MVYKTAEICIKKIDLYFFGKYEGRTALADKLEIVFEKSKQKIRF